MSTERPTGAPEPGTAQTARPPVTAGVRTASVSDGAAARSVRAPDHTAVRATGPTGAQGASASLTTGAQALGASATAGAQVPGVSLTPGVQASGVSLTAGAQVPGVSLTTCAQALGVSLRTGAQAAGVSLTTGAQVPGVSLTAGAQVPGVSLTAGAQAAGVSLTAGAQVPGVSLTTGVQASGVSLTTGAQASGASLTTGAQALGVSLRTGAQAAGVSLTTGAQVPGASLTTGAQALGASLTTRAPAPGASVVVASRAVPASDTTGARVVPVPIPPQGAQGVQPMSNPQAGQGASVRRVLAVIPARGGSKGVPAKNLAPVGGVPLVARAVRECLATRLVTDVVVSTDDQAIAAAAREAGAEVVLRPATIAGDTATSEAAVLHAMDAHEALHGAAVDVVLLVQCTSPFIIREDIDGVAGAVVGNGADTAVTVAPFHGFIWRDAEDEIAPGTVSEADAATGGGYGVNHDKSFRPRRQDRPQDLLETGTAYAMDAPGFRKHQHRFFGRTELVRTDPARVLEIDDPHDLARARALAPLFDADRPGTLPTADDIDAVVLDFDGTQTDDRVLIDADGKEFVSVHRGDGLGIAALRKSALKMLILSTEQNPVVAARARKLKIPVLHGIDRKDLALKQWCEEQGIAPERVLYVGNDVNDLPCFALVGWPVAVASAHDVVRGAARAVTTVPGGDGAIREIASWILGPSLDIHAHVPAKSNK